MLLAVLMLMWSAHYEPSVLTLPIVQAEEVWTVEEMKSLATRKAKEHGLNTKRFLKVIECESGWDRFAKGDGGLSHGLAQFYYPTRDWGMATSSAYEPEVALEIMATEWENDNAYKWSCWRNLYSPQLLP